MRSDVISKWHEIVESKNPASLQEALAEDAIFYSPVVHTPQTGKKITTAYLVAAFNVLCNGSFRYTREFTGETSAILEFITEIEGIEINGVDIITWNSDQKISEFKVMLRPLKAITLVQRLMAAELKSMT